MTFKSIVASLVISIGASASSLAIDNETPISFQARGDVAPVEAFEGEFWVPENRTKADSRTIPVRYIRFPATAENAGSPIIYLSGGPGGSGIRTARDRRFAMFMAMREYGDVIALDQRGAGRSQQEDPCQSDQIVPHDRATSDADFIALHQRALKDCLAQWQAAGIDVGGYNTVENASDIEALRQHLGAEKVALWGISYGSHLALAALKQMEDRIDRVIIASAEGLDQTVKYPARTDAYFERLQASVDQDPASKSKYPDIRSLMQRVHEKLDAAPLELMVETPQGKKPYLFHRRDMQQVASAMISDPNRAAQLLAMYVAMDAGITAPVEGFLAMAIRFGFMSAPGQPISMDLMSTAMDIASGISRPRKQVIEEQAEIALLGSYLNFSLHYDGVAPELDLGKDFRTKPKSRIPVLLFSGTLDGRTYIESQAEAVADMPNVQTVTVVNGGHNLFMSSPEVQDIMDSFMQGHKILTDTIKLPQPTYEMRR